MPEPTYTVAYDTATASDLNGTKTLAALNIGDPQGGAVSIVGGKLKIVDKANGYDTSKIAAVFNAYSLLYPKVAATFDPVDLLNGAFATIYLRFSATSTLAIMVKQGQIIYSNTQNGGVENIIPMFAVNYPALVGLTTLTAEFFPGLSGSTTLKTTLSGGGLAQPLINYRYDNAAFSPSAGLVGVGAAGYGNTNASAAYSQIVISSADTVATPLAPSTPLIVVYTGDSITAGYGTSNLTAEGITGTSHPAVAAGILGTRATVINNGQAGTHSFDMAPTAATETNRFADQRYSQQIAIILAGTNDLSGGATPAQVVANLQSWVATVQSATPPFVAYVGTVTPTNYAYSAQVAPTNAAIKAAFPANRIIDYAALPNAQDPNNVAYYVDGLNWSDQLQNDAGTLDAQTLNAILPLAVAGPAVLSADGKSMTLGLYQPAASTGLVRDFTLSNASGVSGSSLSADGRTLTLTLLRRVFSSEVPTLAYAGTSLSGTNKIRMQPFTALAVTNNSTRRAFGPPAYLNVAYPVLTWPAVAGATGYRLYQNGILVYDTVNAAGVNTATSFTDPAATDGRPIDQPTFTVSAYDANGEGPQSGTPDGTAAALFTQGTTSVTLTDGAVVNGQTVRLSGPQRVVVNDVRYDVPVGVPVLLPNSIKSVLQNANLIA